MSHEGPFASDVSPEDKALADPLAEKLTHEQLAEIVAKKKGQQKVIDGLFDSTEEAK
jgi:hypothetical protein